MRKAATALTVLCMLQVGYPVCAQDSNLPIARIAAAPVIGAGIPSQASETTLSGSCQIVASTKEQIISLSSDAVWEQKSGDTLFLEEGSALVATQTPLNIVTRCGEVHLGKDAVALVRVNHSDFSVTNLSTFKKQSLQIVVGRRLIETNVGMQVLLTNEPPSFRKVFQNPKVGQRAIKCQRLDQHKWLTASDVSLCEMLKKDDMVDNLAQKTSSKDMRKLWERIAKTAACISAVLGAGEVFNHLGS